MHNCRTTHYLIQVILYNKIMRQVDVEGAIKKRYPEAVALIVCTDGGERLILPQ